MVAVTAVVGLMMEVIIRRLDPGGPYDDYEERVSIEALQQLCENMTQDLCSLQEESKGLRKESDDVCGSPAKRKRVLPTKRTQSSSLPASNIDKAYQATRIRTPSAIILGRPSEKSRFKSSEGKQAPAPPPTQYSPSLNFISARKRTSTVSLGRGLSRGTIGKGNVDAQKRFKRVRSENEPPQQNEKVGSHFRPREEEENICPVCDATCWYACECPCHEGCEGFTEIEGMHSPSRNQAPIDSSKGEEQKGIVSTLQKVFSFGTAPRLIVPEQQQHHHHHHHHYQQQQQQNRHHHHHHHQQQQQVQSKAQGTAAPAAAAFSGEDVCPACNATCWFKCACICHEGCDELTDDEGYHSPVRAQPMPRPEDSIKPPIRSRQKGFSFSTAIRSVGHCVDEDHRVKGPEQQSSALLPSSSMASSEPCLSTRQSSISISIGPAPHIKPTKPKPRLDIPSPGPCSYDVLAADSRHKLSCIGTPVFVKPNPAAHKIPERGEVLLAAKEIHITALGPGKYEAQQGKVNVGSNHSTGTLAKRDYEGLNDDVPPSDTHNTALDQTRPRSISACIMPEPKTRSRKVDVVKHADEMKVEAMCKEERETPRLRPKGEKCSSKDRLDSKKAPAKPSLRKKRRSRAAKWEDSKYDSEDAEDSKWASSSAYWDSDDGREEKSAWGSNSEEDGESEGGSRTRQRHRASSRSRPTSSPGIHQSPSTKSLASTQMSPWSHVPSARIMPDQLAGLNWRNRVALAKAREEKQRVKKLFAYDINQSQTEKRVNGGATFEAESRARLKEQQRLENKPGLQQLKAEELRIKDAQGTFLGPQLPHAWVEAAIQKARARDEKHQAVVEAIEAYGSSLRKRLKPVARYVDPTPLPEAAVRARAIRETEEQMRQTWLKPQLQQDIAASQVPDLEKQRGREVIKIKQRGVVKVQDFMAPVEAFDDLGPGRYDIYSVSKKETSSAAAPDFSKMVSRDEGVGPFGQKRDVADFAAFGGDEMMSTYRDGEVLDLEVKTDLIKKRIKAYTFARSGAADTAALSLSNKTNDEGDGPRGGDVLDLEQAMEVGLRRKGAGIVTFDKLQGREVDIKLQYSKKSYGKGLAAWAQKEEENMTLKWYGDVLDLEVKPEVLEKRPVVASFSKAARFEDNTSKSAVSRRVHEDFGGGNDEQELVLSPKDHMTRRTITKGVDISRQRGRWDKGLEDEALRNKTLRDEREKIRFGLEKEIEDSAAMDRAHVLGKVSHRSAIASVPDMSRQSDRGLGETKNGVGMYTANDKKEITASALREELTRAKAVRKAEETLRRRTPSLSMEKQAGRPRLSPRSRHLEVLEEGQAPDREVLKLFPAPEKMSRVKRTKAPVDWSKQMKRFDNGSTAKQQQQSNADPSKKKQTNRKHEPSSSPEKGDEQYDTLAQDLQELYIS